MSRRVQIFFDQHPRPVLLLLNANHADFVRKCNESARRLFGETAYCSLLEMDLGELLPESYDAIRDGDKIRATVSHRTEKSSGADADTVLDRQDWMALRESRINPNLDWEKFVSDVADAGPVSALKSTPSAAAALAKRSPMPPKRDIGATSTATSTTTAAAASEADVVKKKPLIMPPSRRVQSGAAAPFRGAGLAKQQSAVPPLATNNTPAESTEKRRSNSFSELASPRKDVGESPSPRSLAATAKDDNSTTNASRAPAANALGDDKKTMRRMRRSSSLPDIVADLSGAKSAAPKQAGPTSPRRPLPVQPMPSKVLVIAAY
jgi:hypothetical protein